MTLMIDRDVLLQHRSVLHNGDQRFKRFSGGSI
jgi:hypothetical protein